MEMPTHASHTPLGFVTAPPAHFKESHSHVRKPPKKTGNSRQVVSSNVHSGGHFLETVVISQITTLLNPSIPNLARFAQHSILIINVPAGG
jgi:hypothetical protein